MNTCSAIGIMSGTSLDGIDLAYCHFSYDQNKWAYKIIRAETIPYNDSWKNKLEQINKQSPKRLIDEHISYGYYLGEQVLNFIKSYKLKPDLISSHGHTIFHDPKNKINFQLGDGHAIATTAKTPVVWDFRSMDIRKGGQGAPLVPMGDQLLFPEYDYCMNLGGFSNISFKRDGKRLAFDICPVNMALNHLARGLGRDFDVDGMLARKGRIDQVLLEQLNAIPFYNRKGPKSLGKEWFEENFMPLVQKSDCSAMTKLQTICEHIAIQIDKSTHNKQKGKILVTGGGARNTFLLERIRANNAHEVIIPDVSLVDFKEALIFALLGVLRWERKTNCLSSVTGAVSDSSGGLVSLP